MAKKASKTGGRVEAAKAPVISAGAAPASSSKATLEKFESTAEFPVSKLIIEQVIGQDKATEVIRKASQQKRHVLLVGYPGTGKSLLAQAMAELLPAGELEDVLVYANPLDEQAPKIRVVKAGEGRKILNAEKMKAQIPGSNTNIFLIAFLFLSSFFLLNYGRQNFGDVITAAMLIGLFVVSAMLVFSSQLGKRGLLAGSFDPLKLLIDNADQKKAPFVDASGSKAAALLGDCLHDPLQSGGLGTPPHLRLQPGAIHRANKGVLFIDEIATLSFKNQQELLTAMQEKKYSISGQSEMSSGALVHSGPVPCDFVLIASGNYSDINKMHPALRSRIRGYGYEVYMEESLPDTPENSLKLVQFVAQEVVKDGKIPHFSREAVMEIVRQAKRRAGRKNRVTMKLRELGGLVRAAGDLALERKHALVSLADVMDAKSLARTLEQQVAQQIIDLRRDYKVFVNEGFEVGKVNGLAVMGESGIIMPIVAEVAPAASRQEGKIIATGKLGSIAKEAVENVSAIIKKHTGKDTSSFDIHVQFLQTYEGVEGDSASISIAIAVISAIEEVAIDQSVAFTGSLSVRGAVLPVGGVTHKIDAAIEAGLKKVLVPRANFDDLAVEEWKGKIEVVPVSDLHEVLKYGLKPGKNKEALLSKIKKEFDE